MTRIAVVGQVVFDEIYTVGEEPLETRRSDSADRARVGGKGFNIAVAAARFGATVDLVSAVGGDDAGRLARTTLENLGVGTSRVVTCKLDRSTAARTPRVRLTEGRYGERTVSVDIDPRLTNCYLAACGSLDLTEYDAVIYTLELPESCLPALSRALRKRMKRRRTRPLIVGNPAPRLNADVPTPEIGELLRLADVLIPNRFEAAYLIGDDSSAPSDAAQRVGEIYGCEWSIVTVGAGGWAWWSEDGTGVNALPPAVIHDKVGASDVFTAVACLMRLEGADITTAGITAAMAARMAVGSAGGAERFSSSRETVVALEEAGSNEALAAASLLRSSTMFGPERG